MQGYVEFLITISECYGPVGRMCSEMERNAFFWKKIYNLPIKLLQLKADPVEAYMKAPPALVFKGGMAAES